MASLLIIDDEVTLTKNMSRYFERLGHRVRVANSGRAGLELARAETSDLAIIDFQMPDLNGLQVLAELRTIDPDTRAIMVTGQADVSIAVEAMKSGYIDLLTKPVSLQHLEQVVHKLLDDAGRQRSAQVVQRQHAESGQLDLLKGQSPAIQKLRHMIQTVATQEPLDTRSPPAILVTGETGTGKELIARALHYSSPRRERAFIEINCASLPTALVESELFGHEKGAFTDASARRIGLIEAADGGTLFLDEIGELDLTLQAKLLRVLEDSRVRRLGATQDRQINVRVVAATNRDLNELVKQGRFRADLLYRLSIIHIESPPLRQRGQDTLLLAQHFAAKFATRYGKPPLTLAPGAQASLLQYPWPGNVRELRNLMERMALLHPGPMLNSDDLTLSGGASDLTTGQQAPHSALQGLEAMEIEALKKALALHDWNITRAAKHLGISRDTLRYRVEKYGLSR